MADLVFNLIVKDDGSAVIERFGQTTDRVAKRTKTAASKMSRAFGALRRGLGRVTKAVFSIRTAFIGLALGVLSRIVGGLIGVFVDFERTMNKVAAITGATGKQFEALTAQAKELGRTTVFTATQAAQAQALFARSGFEVAEIFEAIPKVLDLAAAGQLNLAQATDIVIGAIRGLKIPLRDLTKLNDILAKASASSGVTVTDLGTAFRKVGPIATAVGVNLKDLVSILGTIGDVGIPATEAGTSLRRIIAALVAPTAVAQKTLDRLGVSVRDSEGRLRSLTKIFSELSEASDDAQDLFRIFGIRAAVVAEVIAANSVRISILRDKLDDAGGTAERMAKIQLRGLVGTLTLLRSAIESAKISIVQALKPAIIDIAISITTFAANVSLAVDALSKFFDKSKAAGEEGSFLKGVLDAITPSAETLIKIFFFLRRAFLSLQFIFLKVKGFFLTFFVTVVPAIIKGIGSVIRQIGFLLKSVGELVEAFPGVGKEGKKAAKAIGSFGDGLVITGDQVKKLTFQTSLYSIATGRASKGQIFFNILMGAAKSALENNEKAVDKTAIAINSLEKNQRGAISTLKELINSVGSLGKKLETLTSAGKKTLGIQDKINNFFKTGVDASETFGRGIVKSLSEVANAFADVRKRAIELQKQMERIRGPAAIGKEFRDTVFGLGQGINQFASDFEAADLRVLDSVIRSGERRTAQVVRDGENRLFTLVRQEQEELRGVKDAGARRAIVEQFASARATATSEAEANTQKAIKQEQFDFILGATASSLGAITKLFDKEGKASLLIQKANAIASVIVSTATGIGKALELPFPLNFAVGAIIAAAGAAQIATISAAKAGGGGAARGPGGAAAAAPGVITEPEVAAPLPPTTQVSISVAGFIGDEARLAEEIARVSREAIGDGLEFGVQASRR